MSASALPKVELHCGPHEERFDVVVAGETLAQFNYDSHGSQCMRDVKELIQRLGIALRVEVTVVDSTGE